MNGFPGILAVTLVVQVVCQLFKLIFYSIRDRKLGWKYLTTAGGMPSAHSAFVTSLATIIGVRDGVASDIFAVSVVFAAIVLYDAHRLRGHVQKQAIVLNSLVERAGGSDESPLSEMVGHSLPEVAVGVAIGGILGAAGAVLLL